MWSIWAYALAYVAIATDCNGKFTVEHDGLMPFFINQFKLSENF